MFDRRTLIAGIASLPIASLPATASQASDPFLDIYRRALDARAYANSGGLGDKELNAATSRMVEIEDEGIEAPPTTIQGAIAGLEWARYEHIQAAGDNNIVLAMIDGALDVLRGLAHA